MTPNDKAQRGKGSKKVKEGLVMGLRHLRPVELGHLLPDWQRFVGTFSLIYISLFTCCARCSTLCAYGRTWGGGQRTHAFIGD